MRTKILTILWVVFYLQAFSQSSNDDFINGIYQYSKDVSDMVYFKSSDAGLDRFLNDFNRRHLRYDEEAIGIGPLGRSPSYGKEWDALSLMYFNSSKVNFPEDRTAIIKKWLDSVYIDRFGYVWTKLDEPRRGKSHYYFGQGWPFPTNDSVYSKGRSAGWDFNASNAEGWTIKSQTSAGVDTPVQPSLSFADGRMLIHSQNGNNLVFEKTGLDVWPFNAPFIGYDMRLTDLNGSGTDSHIDDIQVWFQTNEEATWTADKMVSIKDFATFPVENIRAYSGDRVYFPMFLLPKYNAPDESNRRITAVRMVISGKEGVHDVNIKADLNYFRFFYDTRQTDNLGIYLSTAKTYFEMTNDTAFLINNMDRIRKVTQMYINLARPLDGLLSLDYFTGHDLDTVDWQNKIGHNLVNGYYDNIAVPSVNMDANIYYYKGLTSAAYLEEMAKQTGGIKNTTKVSSLTLNAYNKFTDVLYEQTAESLWKMASDLKKTMQTYFWRDDYNRFFQGYLCEEKGTRIDFGVSIYNMMAISEGIASNEQAAHVYAWLNGDRIIADDHSTGADIYHFQCTPRISTVNNISCYPWNMLVHTLERKPLVWKEHLQNGGAVLYSAYYDILARVRAFGADDGFNRLKGVQAWYDPILRYALANDIHGMHFYQKYFKRPEKTDDILPCGGGMWGNLGMDYEFDDASVVIASIPYGFFGIGSDYNVLTISPKFPEKEGFNFWKIENLFFSGVMYDLSIGGGWVQINSVRGNTDGKTVKMTLPKGKFVKVNGVESTNYTTAGNQIVMTVHFPEEGEVLNVSTK